MNIFSVDQCPIISAQSLCDKHMKMLLESAQILCTNYHLQGIHAPYKRTHENHPSTVWARHSRDNFEWLLEHGLEIAYEYTRRYNKRHKSQQVIEWCMDNSSELRFRHTGLTDFSPAIEEDAICRQRIANFDMQPTIMQYRYFYVFDKPFAVWNKSRPAPQWYIDMKRLYNI
jgi:hypothetical protein